jgi:hypothetical protein
MRMTCRAIAAGLIVSVGAPSAMGQIFTVFTSRTSFNKFIAGPPPRCLPKGEEDFEESTQASGTFSILNDPLSPGVPNGPFLAGLSQPNMLVQSNTLGGSATLPSPRGAAGLYTEAAGGLFGDVVLANTLEDSLDLIFLDEDKCAVGFDTLTLGAAASVQISVFDATGGLITQGNVAPGSFFGIVLLEPHATFIGRINIFGITAGLGVREGADNISLFVEVPAPAGVLTLLTAGGAALRRRRRA